VLAGSAGMFGGGAFSGTLVDCTVTGNSANFGGGAHSSTLVRNWIARNAASQKGGGIVESLATNCVLMNNISTNDAGGANLSLLNNCTLTGNSATNYGSGATESTLLNSIIYFNNSRYGGQNYDSALRNCCTPHVFGGVNSFTNEPRFVDVQAGNLRLQPSSPCINAGDNAWTDDEPDLDGNPRHAGGTVDIGAYEMQSPGSSLSFAWAQQYGFPTDGSADLQDQDGDGLNNLGEWIAGTDPTNNASSLRILRVTAAPATIVWSSVTNRSYVLERSTGLVAPTEFAPLMEGIPGQSSTTSFTDTNNVGPGPMFYRVGVPDPRHQP
jgi:hypothetical protein